jgi:hypothetical protein
MIRDSECRDTSSYALDAGKTVFSTACGSARRNPLMRSTETRPLQKKLT